MILAIVKDRKRVIATIQARSMSEFLGLLKLGRDEPPGRA